MLQRTYPHRSAGVLAAPFFAAAGAAVGWTLAGTSPGSSRPVTALIWALGGAVAGFVSFAGEGPARPAVPWQAATADGVVAGIGLGVAGGIIWTLIVRQAGVAGHGPSLLDLLTTAAVGIVGGGVAGAALGGLVFLIGGERLNRSARAGRRPGGSSRRRTRRQSAPRRRK